MFPGPVWMVEGVWRDGGAWEKSCSATARDKICWKKPWQIVHNGEVAGVYRRDTRCMPKVKSI